MSVLILNGGGDLLLHGGGGILLHEAPLDGGSQDFPAGAGFSCTAYISRRRGARWLAIASIDLDDASEYIATGRTIHPSRVYEARVLNWGSIERTIPLPSGMPQASRMRIRVANTDFAWRDKMGGQTPQGRRIQVKFMQAGASEAAADILFTGTIEEFSTGPGYLEITAVSDMLAWLDEPIPEVITQANYPEFPNVQTAFLPVVLGHVVGRAVSIGPGKGVPEDPDSAAMVAAADAADAIRAEIDAAVFETGPFTVFNVTREWQNKVENKYGLGLQKIFNEFDLQYAAGTLEYADAVYARTKLQALLDSTAAKAQEFYDLGRTSVINTFRANVSSYFGADWVNLLAGMDNKIATLSMSPPSELFAPQGCIPLPHIGFGPVGSPPVDRDRWGGAMHPLWNIWLYRKLPTESAFSAVDPDEYEQNVELARTFGEYPESTFTPTYIDFLVQQPEGTEIRMDADGAYDRAAFGALPAAGYTADGSLGPLRNPVDGFLIMRELIFPKAGDSTNFDVTALGILRDKFQNGGASLPPLLCDGTVVETLTPRELLGRFHACFQTDFFESKRGLLKMVRVDDTDDDRPVLTESHILRNSFTERSPNPTINRFLVNYSRDYGAGNWQDLAIADNFEDQANRGKVEAQSLDFWFVRDALTALSAGTDRQRYTSLISYRQKLDVPLPVVSAWLELDRLFGITHRQGMQISGYANREVRPTGISINPDGFIATIDSVVRVPVAYDENELLITSPCPTAQGTVGATYAEYLFEATGGLGPYTWSATGLPAGMTLSTDGVLSGAPTVDGEFAWIPTVTDALGNTVSGACVLIINTAYAEFTTHTLNVAPGGGIRGTITDPENLTDGDDNTFTRFSISGGNGLSTFAMEHLQALLPPPDPELTLVSVQFIARMRLSLGGNASGPGMYIELFDGVDLNDNHHGNPGTVLNDGGAFSDLPWTVYESDILSAAAFNAIADPTMRIFLKHQVGDFALPLPTMDVSYVKARYVYA